MVSHTSAFLLTGSPMGSQEGEEMERKVGIVQLLPWVRLIPVASLRLFKSLCKGEKKIRIICRFLIQ